MRVSKVSLTIFVSIFFIAAAVMADPYVYLFSTPFWNTVINAGQNFTVTWQAIPNLGLDVQQFNLALFYSGNFVQNIATNLSPTTTSYLWSSDSNLTPSNDYYLQIITTGNGTSIFQSATFTVENTSASTNSAASSFVKPAFEILAAIIMIVMLFQ